MRRLVVRTLATALATSAMVIVPLSVTAPAQADVKTDKSCKVGEYKTNYRITSSYRAPAITPLQRYRLADMQEATLAMYEDIVASR